EPGEKPQAMSFFKRLRRQEAGKPIIAQTINKIADAAEWATRLRVSPPLTLKSMPGGPLIGLGIMPTQGFLAVANGAIPAASSSTDAGIGQVYMVTTTATFTSGLLSSLDMSDGSQTIYVYNPSQTKMGSGNGI